MITEWDIACLKWRGRVLDGKYGHWCEAWDGLPVDETCDEWPCECHRNDLIKKPAHPRTDEGESCLYPSCGHLNDEHNRAGDGECTAPGCRCPIWTRAGAYVQCDDGKCGVCVYCRAAVDFADEGDHG